MRARILIIEDDDDARHLLADALQNSGYDVKAVGSFPEAREWAATPFDAVIADPLVDTRDVNASCTHHEELLEMVWPTPVLLVTGWEVSRRELAGGGVRAELNEPFRFAEVLEWLAAAVEARLLTADERRLVRAYFARLEARYWNGFVVLCTEDVTYHLLGPDKRFARTVTGRSELRAFTEEAFRDYHNVSYEPRHMTARPGYLMVDYRSTWTAAGTEFAGHGTVLFKLREGAIAGIAVRFDPNNVIVLNEMSLID